MKPKASQRNEITAGTTGSAGDCNLRHTAIDSLLSPSSPKGEGGVLLYQDELQLEDEPPPLTAFDVFKAKHPLAKSHLTAAARMAVGSFGQCSIHLAYELAVIRYGLHCSRSWLPALAREIVRSGEAYQNSPQSI